MESKEYLAGFRIIQAPDLDVALKLAAEGSKHGRSSCGRSWASEPGRRPGGDLQNGMPAGRRRREGDADVEVVADESSRTELVASLDEIAREVAWRMLAAALEASVKAYLTAFVGERDDDACWLVVPNGHARTRQLITVAGAIDMYTPVWTIGGSMTSPVSGYAITGYTSATGVRARPGCYVDNALAAGFQPEDSDDTLSRRIHLAFRVVDRFLVTFAFLADRRPGVRAITTRLSADSWIPATQSRRRVDPGRTR
jgi:hypothetical protein